MFDLWSYFSTMTSNHEALAHRADALALYCSSNGRIFDIIMNKWPYSTPSLPFHQYILIRFYLLDDHCIFFCMIFYLYDVFILYLWHIMKLFLRCAEYQRDFTSILSYLVYFDVLFDSFFYIYFISQWCTTYNIESAIILLPIIWLW